MEVNFDNIYFLVITHVYAATPFTLPYATFLSVLVFIIGSKTGVEIFNKLGHCVSYPLICDIGTGYAKVAKQKSTQAFSSPIQPKEIKMVLTVFWATI